MLCLYRYHLVALHGFIKKTRITPEEDLALARKRGGALPPPRISGSLTMTDSRFMEDLSTFSLSGTAIRLIPTLTQFFRRVFRHGSAQFLIPRGPQQGLARPSSPAKPCICSRTDRHASILGALF